MTLTVLEAACVSSFNQFSLHICSLKKLPNSMRLEKFDSITRARATLKKCVKAEAVSNLPVESKQPWAKGPKEGVGDKRTCRSDLCNNAAATLPGLSSLSFCGLPRSLRPRWRLFSRTGLVLPQRKFRCFCQATSYRLARSIRVAAYRLLCLRYP